MASALLSSHVASHSSAPPSSSFPIPRAEGIHEELAWEAEEILGCVTSCCAVVSPRMAVPMFVTQGLSPRPGGVTTGVSISLGMATTSLAKVTWLGHWNAHLTCFQLGQFFLL